MRSIITSISFFAIVISAAACGDVEPQPEPTKEEARAAMAKGDGFDWCEAYGWYGDGICDEFCAEPDPDCASLCYNDDDCGAGMACDLSTCAPCPDGMVCPAVCQGTCVIAPPEPPAPEGDACGGLLGLTCEDGEYCNYPEDAFCGFADATGICEPMPDACIELYDPVCGCDGRTYGNACKAAQHGISVASEGECAPPPAPTCEGACGGGAVAGECWCDDQCEFYGDCCDDYATFCS